MIKKVKGIVLHHVKYKESSAIVYIYTDQYGRQSYLVNNIRGRRSKHSGSLLQSLTLVELEAYHKEGKDIQRVKEIRNYLPYQTIPVEMHKNSQALFLAEILYKVLREEEPDSELFQYLENSLQLLDVSEGGMVNFHLLFLVQLTKFLGFYPENNYGKERLSFDLRNGRFSEESGIHPEYFDQGSSELLHLLLDSSFKDLTQVVVKHELRQKFLEHLMDFYRLHIHSFGTLKSLSILHEIYREEKEY